MGSPWERGVRDLVSPHSPHTGRKSLNMQQGRGLDARRSFPTVHLQAQEAQTLDPGFLLPRVAFLVSALSAFSPWGSSLYQPPTTALTLLFVFPARVSPRVRLHLQAAGLWGESLI